MLWLFFLLFTFYVDGEKHDNRVTVEDSLVQPTRLDE